jgi:probable HAF family extracellular repeat protein
MVIGYASEGTNGNLQTSFVWSGGVLSDFATLPGGVVGGGGTLQGLNSAGEIVGGGGPNGAFYWQNGTRTDLGFFPSAGAASIATAVNDSGVIVGWGYNGPGSYHAWRWQSGAFTDLGTLGGPQSSALGLNSNGVVVGWAQRNAQTEDAVMWQSGSTVDLGALVSVPQSQALSINSSNTVVGITNSGSGNQAIMWTSSTATTLPALPGGTNAGAYGINSSGQIVGFAVNASKAQRAVMWGGGSVTDLNSRILASDPLKPYVTITLAQGVNDSGQVLALGTDSRGSGTHTYVLTPGTGTYYVPDWNHAQTHIVPFVSVALEDATHTVVQQAYTDATGMVQFTGLNPGVTYTPVLISQVKEPSLGLDFVVLDNLKPTDTTQPTFRARYAPYAFAAAAYAPNKQTSQNLTLIAQDGWDPTSGVLVNTDRLAGPFDLLANAVTEAQIVSAAVGSSISWRPLTILWDTANKGGLSSPPNNYDLGLVTGSGGFYSPRHSGIDSTGTATGATEAEDFIYLSGDPSFEAMDIYPAVMTHEMGHFTQAQFSTNPSPNGNHAYSDYEDPILSWIEGNASGIAALVMNTPLQNRVSMALNTVWVDSYNVDTDSNEVGPENNPVGWYQESTVTRLLWRAYDPSGALKMTPASVLAPMYSAAWQAGPWLATPWAYVAQLKKLNPSSSSSIDTLAESLNITSIGNDEWGSTEVHAGNRAPQDVLPPYVSVPISPSPTTVCSAGAPLEYNKGGNVRYLRINGDGASHTLTIQGPSGTVPLFVRNSFNAGSSLFTTSGTTPNGPLVLSVGDCAVAAGQYSSVTSACNDPAPPVEQCWSVTIQ